MGRVLSSSEFTTFTTVHPPTIEGSSPAGTFHLLIDDMHLREHLSVVLASRGYEIKVSAEVCRIDPRCHRPDLFIVEIDPIDNSRLQMILLLKARFGSVPILGIASLNDFEWMGEAVRSGIDDFIFRPVRPVELEVRLQIMTKRLGNSGMTRPLIERRRSGMSPPPQDHAGKPDRCELFIDDRTKTVLIENRTVALSPREYALLKLLASEPRRVFSVREIIACIWPQSSLASSADVQRFIYLLRRRIEHDAGMPRWIKTLRGFGYLLDPSGSSAEDPD